ncbi:MAG: PAS domain-containing protein [Deltaproteobacteria bacterium]|nr:PAS domain-containing protein [Deltaproteobacteria bacterium]
MKKAIFRPARLRIRVIVLLGLLLLVLGFFLFFTSYRAQMKMQEATLGRWSHDSQRRAAALSYFYTERCNEVASLADNPTVTSFFLNKSLGMSMRYGLGGTLNNITSLFDRLLGSRRLGEERIYRALVLLDGQGGLLTLSRGAGVALNETRRNWTAYLTPEESRPEILALENADNEREVIISVPVFFNQNYAGQILCWIDYRVAFRVFVSVSTNNEHHACVIATGGQHFCDVDGDRQLCKLRMPNPLPEFDRPQLAAPDSGPPSMILTEKVANTPFILLESMSKEALGYYAPEKFIAYLLVFAVATIAIAALLLRYLMVNARLTEVVRRENEVAEKNLLLEKEIADRLRSEVDLAESRQRLTLVLQGAEIGFWDWNIETDEVVYNRRLSEMVGYAEGELPALAVSWQQLIHPDDQAPTLAALKAHLRGETEIYESEHRARHKNGEWVWVMDRGAVVRRDHQGRPLRAAGTHLNITPRKKAEQDLLAAHEELERRVEERTRELSEAQAILVNRALEEGRAQLAAMVLHNIGNAITPVAIYLEQFKSERLFEISRFQRRCLDEMQVHADDLTAFVNSNPRGREIFALLAKLIDEFPRELEKRRELLAKISATISHVGEIISLQQSYAGAGREIKEIVDLNALVSDTLRLQEDTICKRRIAVTLTTIEPAPRVLIDKNRLIQVLVNLIKNSCEAIEQNRADTPRELAVETFSDEQEAGLLIRDSGIGIDSDKLETIFIFGESGKGSSGFGLYYCKMFIEANRGRIEVSSRGRGQGASMKVILPRPLFPASRGENHGD